MKSRARLGIVSLISATKEKKTTSPTTEAASRRLTKLVEEQVAELPFAFMFLSPT
jgi:hypothetical protein